MSLALYCLVEGENVPFKVTVLVDNDIADLKKLVQQKKKHGTLHNVDASELILFQLHKPVLIKPAETILNRLPPKGNELSQHAVELKEPTDELSALFPQNPPKGYLSIIVRFLHTPATIRPSGSDKSLLSKSFIQKKWYVEGAIRLGDIAGCYYLDPKQQPQSQDCLAAVFSRQFVQLVGARASGKTTRLHRLQGQLEESGYQALYVSFESVTSSTSPESFWRSFGLELAIAAKYSRVGHNWGEISISTQPEWLSLFEADGRQIVLLIDEFSELLLASSLITNDCLRAFRVLKNSPDESYNVHSIIASGTFGILRLEPTHTSMSAFNVLNPISNPYFSIKETKQLFQQFAQDKGIVIEDAVVQDIWAKTSGHPGLVCLCGRAMSRFYNTFVDETTKSVTTFRSLLNSLLREEADSAVNLLRSRFLGFLDDIEVAPAEVDMADFLTAEGVLLQPDIRRRLYRMSSPLLDQVIRTEILPAKFPGAPSEAPPERGNKLDVLETLTQLLKFIDKQLISRAASRSYKSSKVLVDGWRTTNVPRESVYDTELMRILSNWLCPCDWTVTGQWHLQTSVRKHEFTNILLEKERRPVIVLELLATGDEGSVKSHIEKTPEYMNLLSANEAWVIHFTREDNYRPIWQSDEELSGGVNVVHFEHNSDFMKVVMNARCQEYGGTHKVFEF